jgi:cell division protein ZapA
MSETLKIKLSIADRLYPLQIHPSQEEGLRRAAKKIEEMIKRYEENYAVRDKQDVLAMCALQFAAQVEQKEVSKEMDNEEVQNKLKKLHQLVSEQLG